MKQSQAKLSALLTIIMISNATSSEFNTPAKDTRPSTAATPHMVTDSPAFLVGTPAQILRGDSAATIDSSISFPATPAQPYAVYLFYTPDQAGTVTAQPVSNVVNQARLHSHPIDDSVSVIVPTARRLFDDLTPRQPVVMSSRLASKLEMTRAATAGNDQNLASVARQLFNDTPEQSAVMSSRLASNLEMTRAATAGNNTNPASVAIPLLSDTPEQPIVISSRSISSAHSELDSEADFDTNSMPTPARQLFPDSEASSRSISANASFVGSDFADDLAITAPTTVSSAHDTLMTAAHIVVGLANIAANEHAQADKQYDDEQAVINANAPAVARVLDFS